MSQLKFKATLHNIRIDKEGESKVTFTVPISDLATTAQLAAMTETVLDVSVSVADQE